MELPFCTITMPELTYMTPPKPYLTLSSVLSADEATIELWSTVRAALVTENEPPSLVALQPEMELELAMVRLPKST
jgi:hypothetical protein